MGRSATVARLEAEFDDLPRNEQVWLVERLAQRLRAQPLTVSPDLDQQLAAIADDPAIQRELRQIAAEFADTEAARLP